MRFPTFPTTRSLVFADWPGRSPQEVEDQVTYPLVTNLHGLAEVRVVRASLAFSFSMINVIFEDNVDIYFARRRVLERLNLVTKQLPQGVAPTLGPDATGVGQIFWYTMESDQMNLRVFAYHRRKHSAPLERRSALVARVYKHLAPLEPDHYLVSSV